MRLQAWFLLSLLGVLVWCKPAAGQPSAPTVSLRPRAVASEPGVPDVRVTVDRPRVPLGTTVIFSLTPASIVNDPRYVVTLYFGDRQTEVMRQPQTVHLYRAVGNYIYSVAVKRSGSGDENDKKPPPPRVTLSATPASVKEAELVNFSTQLSTAYPNVRYRFVFGDGSSSGWQSSSQTQHAYARAGNYSAYVDIGDGRNRIGGSVRKRIDVTPVALSVSVTARPLLAQSGKPVNFIAEVSAPRVGTRYRFNFGDGSQTPWQAAQRTQHRYKNAGNYRAFVQVSQFVNNRNMLAASMPRLVTVQSAVSPTPQPTPRPTPDSSPAPTPDASPSPTDSPTGSPDGSPSPTASASGAPGGTSPSPTPSSTASNSSGDSSSGNTWWYLLIAAVILFLVYQGAGYFFVPKPTFASFADPGVAAVADEKGALPLDFQFVLDPNFSAGDYSVSTDEPRLVRNNAAFEERQVFEI